MAGRVASFGPAGRMELELESFETAGGVEEEGLADVTTSVVVLPVVVAMAFEAQKRQLHIRLGGGMTRTGVKKKRSGRTSMGGMSWVKA